MRRLGRRDKGPDTSDVALVKGERVSAVARAATGERIVTTNLAIYLGDARWPWDRITKAVWDAGERTLTVIGSASPDEAARTLVVRLDDATRLLEVVRSEVTSNVVVAQRIESPGFGGAWVTARRVPGADELRWSVVFDPGRDPRDPELRAWADRNVAEIRASTGV